MPLTYGEVTVNGATLRVEPFAWPSTVRRIGIHETATGRLVEVGPLAVQDVDLELEGTERTGWYTCPDSVKDALETSYRAGAAVTITDWRSNTGSFFWRQAPEFTPAAPIESTDPPGTYWTFNLKFLRVS